VLIFCLGVFMATILFNLLGALPFFVEHDQRFATLLLGSCLGGLKQSGIPVFTAVIGDMVSPLGVPPIVAFEKEQPNLFGNPV
jgi:hypothetical protein